MQLAAHFRRGLRMRVDFAPGKSSPAQHVIAVPMSQDGTVWRVATCPDEICRRVPFIDVVADIDGYRTAPPEDDAIGAIDKARGNAVNARLEFRGHQPLVPVMTMPSIR